jgi:hypothetical protein
MVDRTDNRGYIYPECDPPLVKDRSDIDYLRELAVQINNDAARMDADLLEFIERPDAARIAYTGTVTTTGSGNGFYFTVPYDTLTYDNTAGMVDLGANGIRVIERGWYLFTSSLRCTNGGSQGTSVRHLRNGRDEARRLEGPSAPISASEENMATVDFIQCSAGDLVTTQGFQDGAGGTFTFEGRLSCIQLYKLDV